MARAYCDDLRERIAAAFGVSVASALKWSQRLRETGNAGSRPMGGHKRRVPAVGPRQPRQDRCRSRDFECRGKRRRAPHHVQLRPQLRRVAALGAQQRDDRAADHPGSSYIQIEELGVVGAAVSDSSTWSKKALQTIDNPFGPRLSAMSSEHSVTYVSGSDN